MSKMLAAISALAVGGGLSLCDVCGAPRSAAAAASAGPQLASVTHVTTGRMGAVAPAVNGPASPAVSAAETRIVMFKVEGMTCGGCVIGVRKVLTRLAGVSKADVSYQWSRAVVTYDPEVVTVGQMVAAIKTLGYTATVVAPTAT